MTYKERLAIEHPEALNDSFDCGVHGCPFGYGYVMDEGCPDDLSCTQCWNREIPGTETNNEKENKSMNEKTLTAAELLQKAMEYKKQAEIEKMKEQTQEAGSALKAVQDGLVAAGFTEDQAFTITLSMMNMVINKL